MLTGCTDTIGLIAKKPETKVETKQTLPHSGSFTKLRRPSENHGSQTNHDGNLLETSNVDLGHVISNHDIQAAEEKNEQ